MKKMKTYQIPETPTSIAAEPTATYGYTPNHVQALRNRIVDAVETLAQQSLICVYRIGI